MDRLGLSVTDAAGNMRPLQDILADLNSAMAGWSDEDRIKTINTIFNKTDIGDVNYLLGVSRDRWNELSTAIDNSEGAMQKMADTQLDNLEGDIIKFKSALEGAQIVLSDQMNPTLREFVQFGTKAISTLSTAFKDGGLDEAMKALGTILSDGISMIMEMLPTMIDAGMQLLGALGQGLIDNLPAITSAALEVVLMLAEGIISALPSILEAGIEMITVLAEGIVEAIPMLIPAILDAIFAIVDTLTNTENLMGIIDAALEIIVTLARALADAIPQLIPEIPKIIAAIVTVLIAELPSIIAAGIDIIFALIDGIMEALPQLIAMIPNLIIELVGGIANNLDKIILAGPQIILALIEGIIGAIPALLEMIPDLLNSLVDAFESVDWGAIGSNIVTGLMDGLAEMWDSLVDWVTTQLDNLISSAMSFFGGGKSSSGPSHSSGKTSRPRTARAMAVPANESSGNEGISLTADAAPLSINRAAAVRALETAIPNVQARVTTATAAMAPAAGYSMPSSIGNAYGGGESQQPAQTVRPVINIRFTGDIAQLGRILKPVIDQEDIRIGDGV